MPWAASRRCCNRSLHNEPDPQDDNSQVSEIDLTQGTHVLPLEEVEARMRPGRFSQVGFLGPTESLAHVLETDARALSELGLDQREVADGLGQLLAAAVASKRNVAHIGHYRVRLRRYK